MTRLRSATLCQALSFAFAAATSAARLDGGDARQRARAVDEIIRADDPRRVGDLYGQLAREEDVEVRGAIALALGSGRLRNERGFKTLVELMHSDPSHQVRLAAAQSLLQFEGAATLERIEGFLREERSEELRYSVCGALGRSALFRAHPLATQMLAGLLAEDPSAPVRLAAVKALAQRGDWRALSALRRAAEKDPEPELRKEAAKAAKALLRAQPEAS